MQEARVQGGRPVDAGRYLWGEKMTGSAARVRCRELKAKDGGDLGICEGHALGLEDGLVVLAGEGDAAFFERAEEVEDYKVRACDYSGGVPEPHAPAHLKTRWEPCLPEWCWSGSE